MAAASNTVTGKVDPKGTRYNAMDEGIFSIAPPPVSGKERVFSVLTLSPSADDPGSDAVDAQVTVIGGSGDVSSDVSKMLLVTSVLVHTMHTELTGKIMAMDRDLKDMGRSLTKAQRSKETAERAVTKSKLALKAMKQSKCDLQDQLDNLEGPDVHVEEDASDGADDVTMTSASQEDVTGD